MSHIQLVIFLWCLVALSLAESVRGALCHRTRAQLAWSMILASMCGALLGVALGEALAYI